jgi:cytoskeletal protein CcmA (bactofilin family)
MEILSKKGSSPHGDMATTIGAEAYFHGVVTVRGSLYVEGQVEGDIHEAQTVVVGRNGCVKGNISAEHVVVSGAVEGDIAQAQELEIKSGGRVTGNIHTKKLVIEEGAVFEGCCSMRDGAETPEKRSRGAHEKPADKSRGDGARPGSREEEEGEPLHS